MSETIQSVAEQLDRLGESIDARMAERNELLAAAKHVVMEWRQYGYLTDSCRVLEAAIENAERAK